MTFCHHSDQSLLPMHHQPGEWYLAPTSMTDVRHRLDPALLPALLAVVDTGRISAAAKTLHLSQPAVTAQIRKLEEGLGAPLFVRSVRGVVPTPAGERLAGYARAVQKLLDEAATAVGGRDDIVGELVLAASTTIAAHVVPPVLGPFHARYPTATLRVEVGNTEDVLAAVSSGRVPLGLVEGHARAAGVRLEPFVEDEIVAVVASQARMRIRTAADFAQQPILWREAGSGTRSVLDRALRRAGIRKKPLPFDVELGSTEAILGAAAAGLGVAFVSRWSLRTHLAAGRVVVVPGLDFVVRRTFHWALPTGGLRGAAAAFHDFAQRHPPSM
jgi:DNA-binding transcriptional LysR family regulator